MDENHSEKQYMNRQWFFLLVGIILISGGCTLEPKYTRPEAPVPTGWPTGAAYQEPNTAAGAPGAAEITWQEFFTDQRLQQIIETALINNRDLHLAALNVERTRALYGIQRAELLPTLDATGSGSRQRIPADLSSTRSKQITERYDVNLGMASWEIDFFGRLRSLKDRALQEFLASEQARRSAQILLVSSVADAYLTLAADRENLTLAETTVKSQRDAYDLIKRRYDRGHVSELDIYQAQTQVDTARRNVALYTQLVAQDENALNLLVGSPIPTELLPLELANVTPPQEISAGVSSEVLLNRPDVLQAENLLKAAYADIGAARAAFFPRISLTAGIGTASKDLSGLFEHGSGTWNYSPEIVMPIFDARTWFALKATKVQREMAVTQYEITIQNAFREVADALAIRDTMEEQLSAQQSLVHAVAETYRLSNSRYDKGIDSYLNVLVAQRSLFAVQQEFVYLRLAKLTNQARLYAVLGGGGDPLPETIEP
jgi:outer membrane protein, multidrug efflux system